MKNQIEVIPWCRMYSYIKVTKNGVTSKHIVSNHGWLDLEWWKNYFENDF